jgi:hypothetical protein
LKACDDITLHGKQLIKEYYVSIKKDAEKKRDKLIIDLQYEVDTRCD